MTSHFKTTNYITGISTVIKEIGDALCTHFPYDGATDKNELSDELNENIINVKEPIIEISEKKQKTTKNKIKSKII